MTESQLHPALRDLAETRTVQALLHGRLWHTDLKSPDSWPPALPVLLATVLALPTPASLNWGPQLIFLPNDAALEVLGPGAERFVGRPVSACFSQIWPRIADLVGGALEGRGVHVSQLQVDLQRRDAPEENWWDASCAPARDEAGAIVGIVCAFREATASVVHKRTREDATARLREALAAGDRIGAFDWDLQTNRVRAETSFALFYSVDPIEADKGVPVERYLEAVHPDDRERLQEQVVKAIEAHESFHCEYRLLSPSGQVQWISAQGQPEYNAEGQCVRFPGLSFDITVNKLQEGRRNAAGLAARQHG